MEVCKRLYLFTRCLRLRVIPTCAKSSSSSDSSDDDRPKVSKAPKTIQADDTRKNAASKKLSDLLLNLKVETRKGQDTSPTTKQHVSLATEELQLNKELSAKSSFTLAKPTSHKAREVDKDEEHPGRQRFNRKTKKNSQYGEGHVKRQFNYLPNPFTSKMQKEDQSKSEDVDRHVDVEPTIMEAVKVVSASLGRDHKKTESELLLALRSQSAETQKNININQLVYGMKVDSQREKTARVLTEDRRRRMNEVDSHWEGGTNRRSFRGDKKEWMKFPHQTPVYDGKKMNLFGGEPLGIFDGTVKTADIPKATEGLSKSLWSMFEEKEFEKMALKAPSNAFEEMIMWTDQKKLWKFPIDNEQGLEAENAVPFHEHVFMEHHLKDGFPLKGPVRHFMELVCVGLSKNHYITVERKLAHIQWFREYFKEKEIALLECEMIEAKKEDSANA